MSSPDLEAAHVPGRSPLRTAMQRFSQNRGAVIGGVVVCLIALASLVGPPILRLATGARYDSIPADASQVASFGPSLAHPMGTDNTGRDILARVLVGGRISLMVTAIATSISLLIGVSYGAVSGYVGGKVDELMMRIVDILFAIPFMIFVIVLLALFGRQTPIGQLTLLFAAIGAVSWLTMARIVRGQVLTIKNQEYIIAARSIGISLRKLLLRHVVPNIIGPVIVYATLNAPSVMLFEAFLSFLGLGVQAPLASWGSLVAEGAPNLAVFPWQLICPGVTLAVTLIALNFVGDGLRDALDPQKSPK